jgi:hypothetical protein
MNLASRRFRECADLTAIDNRESLAADDRVTAVVSYLNVLEETGAQCLRKLAALEALPEFEAMLAQIVNVDDGSNRTISLL